MIIRLDPLEARVLGVLMEKEATTPDAYPLSINAITAGCNQKTNRDPVMEVRESAVQAAVDNLVKSTLLKAQGSAGGRVPRYAHRLSMRLFGEYEFSAAERAVLCVLLLRGAQTAGEIRGRAGRLHEFADVGEVESVLTRLAERKDGPHVAELTREPGRRESRWVHCFCERPVGRAPARSPTPIVAPSAAQVAESSGSDGRMSALEARVQRLETQLARLHDALGMASDGNDAGS